MTKVTLKKRLISVFSILIISTALQSLILGAIAKVKRENRVKTAYIQGQSIATAIQLTLENILSASESIKYFYKQYGEDCFDDFEDIAASIAADTPSIGSMYIAPKAVIRVAYPKEVNAATIGFEMLKNPFQGPRAQLAIDTKKITVAGPHNLVEGGVGFIIRNPVFEGDEFLGFSIIVLNWDEFVEHVLDNVQKTTASYKFAVWKDDYDETAITDEDGFIFRNTKDCVSKKVDITFNVPNDTWHLAVEPETGWLVYPEMVGYIAVSLILSSCLILLFVLLYYSMERKKQLEREQTANEAKTAFLFNMSHDIRTPMNAIIGYSDLIEKNIDNKEKILDYMGKIKMANGVLLSLVNNVLELARIESGKTTLDEEYCDVTFIIDSAEAVFVQLMEAKNINFTINNRVKHPYVICDKDKVGEIILNILSNAYKYTSSGGSITVDIDDFPSDDKTIAMYQTRITDTGIGMSEEFQKHIFEEFSRARSSTESKVQGTGLGMAIVKNLTDLMKGTIKIESQLDKGTTVTITLPHKIAEKIEVSQNVETNSGSKKSISDLNILLAEDNDLNAEIAITVLEGNNCKVKRACDGLECVEMLKNSSDGEYDLILMDIQMPRMDGYKATEVIRSMDDKKKAQIPIIAMTANAFAEDKKNALDAGMNGHIAKPIDVSNLMETIGGILK